MHSILDRALRLAGLVAVVGLGACQSSGPSAFASLNASPSGVPIALEVIDGAPAPVRSALTSELVSAASSRNVEIAGAAGPARYEVRGYLSTETTADGGQALAYVWDVFDAEKRRAKRLTGSSPIRSASPDPWSGLDKETLAKLAAQSMDEIAVFLAESKAAAGPTVTAQVQTGTELGSVAR